MNVRATLVIAAAASLSLAAAGCVTTPNHGDSIADRHSDTFDFAGYTENYNPKIVYIEALDKDGEWWVIDYALVGKTPFKWNALDGGGYGSPLMDLYPWRVNDVQIPLDKRHFWRSTSHPGFKHECEVRVRDPQADPKYTHVTFDQNYPGDVAAWYMSLLELWTLCGHGAHGDYATMTLYSEN